MAERKRKHLVIIFSMVFWPLLNQKKRRNVAKNGGFFLPSFWTDERRWLVLVFGFKNDFLKVNNKWNNEEDGHFHVLVFQTITKKKASSRRFLRRFIYAAKKAKKGANWRQSSTSVFFALILKIQKDTEDGFIFAQKWNASNKLFTLSNYKKEMVKNYFKDNKSIKMIKCRKK